MSNEYKLRWAVFVLLMGLVWWLVCVDLARGDTSHSLRVKDDSSASYVRQSDRLQPTARVQVTAPVQKTQSSAQLHKLSDGVEMRPIEMLRSGRL